MKKRVFTAYTDGGFDMNSCIGASAVVILTPDLKERLYEHVTARKCEYDPTKKQRTNEQELGAMIRAVMSVPNGSEILIISDSQYAVKVLSKENNASANLDLIARFDKEVSERCLKVKFKWVRGHNGDLWNERADQLCQTAMSIIAKTNEKKKTWKTYNKCYEY